MKKINLLQLITGLNTGGAEKVVLDLVRTLDKEKYNIYVGSLLEHGELLLLYQNSKINLTTGKLKRKSSKGFISTFNNFKNLVQKKNINVIHAHMFHALVIATLIKFFHPHIKIVFTPHTINLNSRVRELIVYCLKPFRYHDILFSEIERVRYYIKNPVIIPNGIKINNSFHSPIRKKSIFTFICVGGFRQEKNYVNFINALGNANLEIDYQLLIAGSGDLEIEIKQAIKENNLQEYVKLIGLRNDIPSILSECHAFLMPSLWEGLPISLLEAGVAGLPVIATPVGNIPKIIDESTGYLCNWQDFPNKMTELYMNYDKALLKGLNLRKNIARDYSLDTVVKKHEQLYTNLI